MAICSAIAVLFTIAILHPDVSAGTLVVGGGSFDPGRGIHVAGAGYSFSKTDIALLVSAAFVCGVVLGIFVACKLKSQREEI